MGKRKAMDDGRDYLTDSLQKSAAKRRTWACPSRRLPCSVPTDAYKRDKAADHDTGGKENARRLKRVSLDGMTRIVDGVFRDVPPLLHSAERRLNTIFHSVANDGFDAGNLAQNIVDRSLFLGYLKCHKFCLFQNGPPQFLPAMPRL
jgi:hypothetical protein